MYSISILIYVCICVFCVHTEGHEKSKQKCKSPLLTSIPARYNVVVPKVEFHYNRQRKTSPKTSSRSWKSSHHSKVKRGVKTNDHSDAMRASVTLTSGNTTYVIDLTPNKHLFSPEYLKKESAENDGKKNEQCEFQGALRNKPDSWAALSLCGSVSGVLWDGPETYIIEPANHFRIRTGTDNAPQDPILGKESDQNEPGGYRRRENMMEDQEEMGRLRDQEDGRRQPDQTHYFFRSVDLEEEPGKRCGVTPEEEEETARWIQDSLPGSAKSATSDKALQDPQPGRNVTKDSVSRQGKTHGITRRAATTFKLRGTIEVYIVASKGLYDRLRSKSAVKKRCHKIANMVDAIYRPLGLRIVVVEVEVWTTGDRTQITSSSTATLNAFESYRKDLRQRGINHDNLQLLTTQRFDGSAVGKASVSTMCRESSVGVNTDSGSSLEIEVAITMAHEMGHNLGLSHAEGKCSCSSNFCIMEPTSKRVIGDPAYVWSDCSKDGLLMAFSRGLDYCLHDDPFEGKSKKETPVCGNGIVEDNEQCDCGPAELCWSSCCDGANCKLFANSTCSSGACCNPEDCKPMPAATTCRPKRGECDLPEYCDGLSESCPPDLHVLDGTPCGSSSHHMGEGYCVKGQCGSHHTHCQILWGPGAVVSDESCYKINRYGDEIGNCGKMTNGKFKKCTTRDVKCGSTFCLPKDKMNVNFLNKYYIMKSKDQVCIAASSLRYGREFGLAPDGAKCGENQMCVDQVCQEVTGVEPKVPAESWCHKVGCGKNGVCNNLNQCHCHDGFNPPDCKYPGLGGSVHSGPATTPTDPLGFTILLTVFMVVVPLLALILCILCNMRHFWETKGRRVSQRYCPCCTSCCDTCCCPLLSRMALWMVTDGPFRKKRVEKVEIDANDEGRRTICEVNLDVKPPEPDTNVMGIADERLVTVITTITPKNSPDTRRKVVLKSSSPSLHSNSTENLDQQRPPYSQSISRDSRNISDSEEDVATNTKEPVSSKVSMGSLISVFRKYKAPKSTAPSESPTELRRSKGPGSMKAMPLSRFVVDPLVSNRSSQHGMPPTEALHPPKYRRSVSIDPKHNKGMQNPPPVPSNPPRPMKATKSEENLRHLRVQNNAFLHADKDRSQALRPPLRKDSPTSDSEERFSSSSSISSQPAPAKKVALLPPKKPSTPPLSPETDITDSKKSLLLPSHLKSSSSRGSTPTREAPKRPMFPLPRPVPSGTSHVTTSSAPTVKGRVKELSSKFQEN